MSVKEALKEKDFMDEHFVDDVDDQGIQDIKYLTFSISNEVYGIDISQVTEIIDILKDYQGSGHA